MESNGGGFSVELVDDQALVRDALAALLRSFHGIEVVATAGGLEEAIRFAQELHPRIVLMDVLAESRVFDGARTLVERCPGTLLVILDESPNDGNAREALRIGAAGYLTKQQPYDQVESALRLAARGGRVYAPEIARRLVLSADGVRLAPPIASPYMSRLTPRELDVLVCLARGSSVKQCAQALGIGASTVGNHKSRLMKKLNVHKTVELVHLAMREGMVPRPSMPSAN